MQRYEAYKDSGVEWIGEIPEGWEIHRLKTLAVNDIRKTPTNQGAYIGLENIQPWTQRFLESTEDSNDPEGNYYDDDCVLFGKLRPYLAKVFVPTESGQCSSEFLILRSELLSRRYLSYSLINGRFIDEVNSLTYGAKMPRASWETIGSIPSPLPSAREQAAIADYLDEKTAEIDSIVSQTERSIGLLREYRKSVISEAVTKGLDPDAPMRDSGVEWIGEIPEGWEVVRIKEIARLRTGHTPPTQQVEYFGREIKWFTPGDFDGDVLRESERGITQQAIVDCKAPVFPADSTLLVTIGTAGKSAYLPFDASGNQQITCLIPKRCMGKWLFYSISNESERFLGLAMFTILPILNNDYLYRFELALPPLPEQQAIADYLDEKTAQIDSLITDKQRQVELLKEYRKSLISEAVTGKFKVLGLE